MTLDEPVILIAKSKSNEASWKGKKLANLEGMSKSPHLIDFCCMFLGTGESMTEAMKNSPHNGPGTPREDMPPASVPPGSGDMGPYPSIPYQDNNPNNPMNNPVNVNNVSVWESQNKMLLI